MLTGRQCFEKLVNLYLHSFAVDGTEYHPHESNGMTIASLKGITRWMYDPNGPHEDSWWIDSKYELSTDLYDSMWMVDHLANRVPNLKQMN